MQPPTVEPGETGVSNPGTRICFRVGDEDARKLAEGFSFFESRDLQNLDKGQAICRVERSTVCLLFAARHRERVDKIAVISAPIVGATLRFFPRVFGYRPLGWITYHNLWLYRRFYRLLARRYSKHAGWPDMMDRDVSHTTLEAFFASIGSLRRTDLRPILPRITAPVLAVYGARDNVVDPGQWKVLQPRLPQLRTVLLPSSGHFPMLDDPTRFLHHLGPFLDASTA